MKERKARTRRLIQEGRCTGKSAAGSTGGRGLTIWKNTCGESWQDTIENGWEVSGKPGAFLFIRRGTYSPPAKAGGGSPSRWSGTCALRGRLRLLGSRWTRLHFCQTASLAHAVGAGVSVLEAPVHGGGILPPHPPPACVNLPPAADADTGVEQIVPPLLVVRRILRRTCCDRVQKKGCCVSQ